MKKSIQIVFAFSLSIFFTPVFGLDEAACTVSDRAADFSFTLKDMYGEDVALSDYKGKVILLDFWATWCGPCRIEIPGFIELFDKYEEQGLAILGVSIDDPVDSLLFYADEMGMDYPVLIGDGRDDVKDSYGPIVGYPTTLLINREGDICYSHSGYSPKEKFESEILSLL